MTDTDDATFLRSINVLPIEDAVEHGVPGARRAADASPGAAKGQVVRLTDGTRWLVLGLRPGALLGGPLRVWAVEVTAEGIGKPDNDGEQIPIGRFDGGEVIGFVPEAPRETLVAEAKTEPPPERNALSVSLDDKAIVERSVQERENVIGALAERIYVRLVYTTDNDHMHKAAKRAAWKAARIWFEEGDGS